VALDELRMAITAQNDAVGIEVGDVTLKFDNISHLGALGTIC
jgi:hypothetical protein